MCNQPGLLLNSTFSCYSLLCVDPTMDFVEFLYFLIPRICPPFGTHGRPLVGGLPGIPIARWVRLHHVSVEAIFNCSLNFDFLSHLSCTAGMWPLDMESSTRWCSPPRASSASTWWSSLAWSPLPFLRSSLPYHCHLSSWSSPFLVQVVT